MANVPESLQLIWVKNSCLEKRSYNLFIVTCKDEKIKKRFIGADFFMSFFKYVLTISLTISSFVFSQSEYPAPPLQDNDLIYRLSNTTENIYTGVTSSIEWYDLSLVAFSVVKRSFVISDEDKPFSVQPFGIDRSIANSVGISGRHSPGSMDQNYIPSLIMYSRLGYSIVNNLISPESSSPKEYQNIFLMYKSMAYTAAITEVSKRLINRSRPDGSDTKSFFSGHTSSTFAAATFLYREMDDVLDDWNVTKNDKALRTSLKTASFTLLYGWAGYVGYSRMMDNKHYLSDVLLGAAVGTVVSNFIYDFYSADENENTLMDNFSIGYINDAPSLNFSLQF